VFSNSKNSSASQVGHFAPKKYMVGVGANDIRRGKTREEKIQGILYLLCSVKLPNIPKFWLHVPQPTRLETGTSNLPFASLTPHITKHCE